MRLIWQKSLSLLLISLSIVALGGCSLWPFGGDDAPADPMQPANVNNGGLGGQPNVIPIQPTGNLDPNQPAIGRSQPYLGNSLVNTGVVPGRPPQFNPFVDPYGAIAAPAIPSRPEGEINPEDEARAKDYGALLYSYLQGRGRSPEGMAFYNDWFRSISDFTEDSTYWYKSGLNSVDDFGRSIIPWW